jgi:hypothetical protein
MTAASVKSTLKQSGAGEKLRRSSFHEGWKARPLLAALSILATPSPAAALDLMRLTASFAHNQLVITNHAAQALQDCSVDINPQSLDWDFYLAGVDIEANTIVVLDVSRFRGARQEIYDPKRWPPLALRVVCTDPDGARDVVEIPVSTP